MLAFRLLLCLSHEGPSRRTESEVRPGFSLTLGLICISTAKACFFACHKVVRLGSQGSYIKRLPRLLPLRVGGSILNGDVETMFPYVMLSNLRLLSGLSQHGSRLTGMLKQKPCLRFRVPGVCLHLLCAR